MMPTLKLITPEQLDAEIALVRNTVYHSRSIPEVEDDTIGAVNDSKLAGEYLGNMISYGLSRGTSIEHIFFVVFAAGVRFGLRIGLAYSKQKPN